MPYAELALTWLKSTFVDKGRCAGTVTTGPVVLRAVNPTGKHQGVSGNQMAQSGLPEGGCVGTSQQVKVKTGENKPGC